jgi:tetratricopeptide (TPR) repeat protein
MRRYLGLEVLFSCILATIGFADATQDYAARMRAAGELERQGDYDGAEKVLVAALKEAESFGRDSVCKGIALNNLGSIYHSQGRYQEAEERYVAAMELWKTIGGAVDRHLVHSLLNLTALYVETGQHIKANRLGLDAVAVQLEASRPGCSDFAGVLSAMGAIAFAQARYHEAELHFQRALALWEKLTPNSLEAMQTLNSMGAVYKKAGRLADALRCYERALRVAETMPMGSMHPERVKLLANLGVAHFLVHGPAEAEPFFKDALAIGESTLGPKHPVVGQVLLNYSVALKQTKRKAEAKVCERRGMAILEAASRTDARRYTVDIGDLRKSPRH